MALWWKALDDDHAPLAGWAGQSKYSGLIVVGLGGFLAGMGWRSDGKQGSNVRDVLRAVPIAEEAVMSDPVLASGQDVDHEATDELVSGECHGFVAPRSVDAVIFDTEGDAVGIGADEPTVRDRDPMRVSR